MPRLADHDERRAQITGAARRVIARDGLAAATFQSVAAEAGVSVRLVQYYFGTKRKFLLATHQAVVADAGARFTRRLGTLGADPEPRAVIRAILTELLPTDADRRQDTIVLNIFHSAALTASDSGGDHDGNDGGDGVGAEDTLGAPRFLVTTIAEQLRRARAGAAPSAGEGNGDAAGRTGDQAAKRAAERAAELDAELIVAGVAGLAQTLLVDASAAERADALLDRLLARMVEP